jgi:hypothetical protein
MMSSAEYLSEGAKSFAAGKSKLGERLSWQKDRSLSEDHGREWRWQMPSLVLPRRIPQPPPKRNLRSCPGHRAWVRRHYCSVPRCLRQPIECVHVRGRTDGGTGMKPTDRWVISLCVFHHREQHQIGERTFEENHSISMVDLAREFARRSPHWLRLSQM